MPPETFTTIRGIEVALNMPTWNSCANHERVVVALETLMGIFGSELTC